MFAQQATSIWAWASNYPATPLWLHARVSKCAFTLVNLHFLPWSEATKGQPEQLYII